jgi:polysaccharide biosynthesis protein PslG
MNLTRSQRLLVFVTVWFGFTLIVSYVMFMAITRTNEPVEEDALERATLPAEIRAAAPVATEVQVRVPFNLGVHVQETHPSVEASVMSDYLDAAHDQLQLGWVRFEMRWDYIEPEPGVYNWANWDTTFDLASERGLKVLLTVIGTPAWAREAAADPNFIGPPLDYRTYAEFLRTVLTRYSGSVQAVEVWYEMNIFGNWASVRGLNPADYVDMLEVAAEVIREAVPAVMVVSGGLETTGGSEQAIDDFVFMDGMIDAGLLDTADCVGVHHNGYNIGPNIPWDDVPPDSRAEYRGPFDNPHHSWSFYSTVNTIARKISNKGYATPLCITQFGWPSSEDLEGIPPGLQFAADNTLTEQRTFTVRAVNLMQEWGFVRLAFIWNLNAGPEEAFNAQVSSVPYSLIRPNYAFAPLWFSIGNLAVDEMPLNFSLE